MIKNYLLCVFLFFSNSSVLFSAPVWFWFDSIAMLDENGNVWVKGENFMNRFGYDLPKSINKFTKRELPIPIQSIAATALDFTIFLDVEGNVWICGYDNCSHEVKNAPAPVKIKSVENIIKITAGRSHAILLDDLGNVSSFGSSPEGALGQGEVKESYNPEQITVTDAKISNIASGWAHVILLDDLSKVWGFGCNDYGQCGSLNNGLLITPFIEVVEIAAGSHDTIILDSDGFVWLFGCLFSEKTDLKDFIENNPGPKRIENLDSIISIQAGSSHNVLLSNNGEVFSFGSNYLGQLGLDKEIKFINEPKKLDLPFFAQAVFAGFHSTILVDESDQIWYCGNRTPIGDDEHIFKPKKLDLPFQMMLETRNTQITNACNVAMNDVR